MKIAILETGHPPKRLAGRFPSYGRMTADLVGGGHDYRLIDVQAEGLPEDPAAFDGYMITGSPAGVYDPDPWIVDLLGFLRGLDPRQKLVGICFGHQALAQAFGGHVEKSDRGWGLGLHSYTVAERLPFMDEAERIAVPVSHQDQVVRLPPAARVIAGSAFTPYGALAYSDRAALSFQCHPEFAPDYARALTDGHPAAEQDPDFVRRALTSLEAPHDSQRVGGWIRQFLAED
ncbi:type 1 glutamine amidotransferase [Methylobacterium organophilum]|uniref:glutamine amidotransferase-related protein n=1 Tax=Methylobacterium organophilum TaxID=410 RepID=UPI001F1350BC|nr:type 1 glutamine amidotransferase [Methylobacterium organophilum]UMY15974.1 type 1 glutamine amidotransferase [Methylobacterium organophilum]